MDRNLNCCFCNKYSIEAVFAMALKPKGYNSSFFRGNRFCAKCRYLMTKKIVNFSSSEFIAITDDVKNCLNELNFFVPKIDYILLERFAQMLVGLDQYSFAFSSKEASHLLIPKLLIVAKEMNVFGKYNFVPHFENSNILVTEKFVTKDVCFNSNLTKYIYQNLFDSILSKQVTIKAKFIELCNIQITADIFFQLLSPQLIQLKCVSFELTTLLNPIDFIEKLPNIEKFIFSDTHYSFIWNTHKTDEFDDFPINCKKLKKYCLPFKSLNLSFEVFSGIAKKWSKYQTKIFLILIGTNPWLMLPADMPVQSLYELLIKEK